MRGAGLGACLWRLLNRLPRRQCAGQEGSPGCGYIPTYKKEPYRMKSEMLINVSQPEECRIAIIEDGLLEELYIERASQESYVGNIYKGRIVNLEPSIQAAFVDFGVGRNGFLHVSDVEPQYFRQGGFDPGESMGEGRMADIDVGDDDVNDGGSEGPPDEPRRMEGRGGRGRGGPDRGGQDRGAHGRGGQDHGGGG